MSNALLENGGWQFGDEAAETMEKEPESNMRPGGFPHRAP
jgi:hypothetical protein